MRSNGATISVLLWMALVAPILAMSARPPHVAQRADQPEPDAGAPGPKRIVVYPPLLVPYVTVDQSADSVIAASLAAQDACTRFFRAIFPRLSGLPLIAARGRMSPIPGDPEQVLLLAPDAAIVWASATGGLEKVGVPLRVIATTDPAEASRILGGIAGRRARAAALDGAFTASEAVLMAAVDSIARRRQQRAIVVWRYEEDSWRVASVKHRSAQALERLGAAPAPRTADVATGSIRVDIEWLLAADPEAIFIIGRSQVNDDPRVEYRRPELRSLRAVRDRRIYKVPVGATHMDGVVEWPLLERWYAELLYPDQMNSTLRDDFKRTFMHVYGHTLDEDDLDAMLSLAENGESAAYDRFSRQGSSQSGGVAPAVLAP